MLSTILLIKLTYLWIGILRLDFSLMTHKECGLCLLVIAGREFCTNIFIVDGGDYNVILGLDWSSTFYEMIYYKIE